MSGRGGGRPGGGRGGSGRGGSSGGGSSRGGSSGGGSSRGGPARGGASGGGRNPRSGGEPGRSDAGGRGTQRSGGRGSSGRSSGPRGGGAARGGADRTRGPGGDQVEGRQAVRELLLAGRRRVREIVMAADLDPASIVEEIRELADEGRVPITELARTKFDAQARTESAQGVMARAEPLPDLDLEDIVTTRDGRPPFLLVLDGITDPGNLGAILRTGECAGVTGVVLPRHRSARITPTVTKTAAGAIEHIPIATVAGIPKALGDLAAAGIWSVGLDVAADTTLDAMPVADGPIALVLGAEGKGLSRLVRERCDLVVTIPLQGVLDSLNVSAAAAVACFEVARRRRG